MEQTIMLLQLKDGMAIIFQFGKAMICLPGHKLVLFLWANHHGLFKISGLLRFTLLIIHIMCTIQQETLLAIYV